LYSPAAIEIDKDFFPTILTPESRTTTLLRISSTSLSFCFQKGGFTILLISPEYVVAARAAENADDLHWLLQSAIQLEHATIPPYLAAAYSLKLGINNEIRNAIFNIAEEEMLHMAIVANVLNALGGTPEIDRPEFIPTYPGPLPMNIGDGFQVGIRKFSKTLVEDVFMRIEEPEHPIHFPVASVSATKAALEFSTIGAFYRAVIEKINELGDAIFVGDPARQVSDAHLFPPEQLFKITNSETAVRALTKIVKEGEGTSTMPFDDENEPAHYYRFEEILRGLHLVEDPTSEKGYSFKVPEIRFNPDDVFDSPDDTKVADYAAGTVERIRVDKCNLVYSDILRSLQKAFDGEPTKITEAVSLMGQFQVAARAVVSRTNPATGRQCGLTFEYAPPV
jgi:rubrerythrin